MCVPMLLLLYVNLKKIDMNILQVSLRDHMLRETSMLTHYVERKYDCIV